MPIRVIWENKPQLVACFIIEGHWSWEDYHRSAREVLALLDQLGCQADIITDFRSLYVPPGVLVQLAPIREFLQYPNVGVNVLVTSSSFVDFLVSLFKRFYPLEGQTLLFASTVEEAHAVLARRRQQPIPRLDKAARLPQWAN